MKDLIRLAGWLVVMFLFVFSWPLWLPIVLVLGALERVLPQRTAPAKDVTLMTLPARPPRPRECDLERTPSMTLADLEPHKLPDDGLPF